MNWTLDLFRESYKKPVTIHILKFLEVPSEVLNNHAPLKQILVRGNHALFITKELGKAIMSKSKAKRSCAKWPSRESFVAHKKSKTNVINYLENPK